MSFFMGIAHNGRRAMLQSSVYAGEVGVRDRGNGHLELAWFGTQPTLRAAVAGSLDSVAIRITGLRVRPLRGNGSGSPHAGSSRAIVATAEVVPQP